MEEYLGYKERKFLDYLFINYKNSLQVAFSFKIEDLDFIGAKDIFEFENLLMAMEIRGYISIKCVTIFRSHDLARILLTEKALNKFNSK